ncbi:MAG: methyltransferase domain-containing protein [Alphaproteobacteria bacterium]
MIFDALLGLDRRLRLAAKAVQAAPGYRADLAGLVAGYLDAYCAYHRIGPANAAGIYNDFIARYLDDLAAFRRDRRYPLERGESRTLGRADYDLALMLSYLLAAHRFAILRLLADWALPVPALVVGCGAGVEIEVLGRMARCPGIVAFDTELSPFCAARHDGVDFREQAFAGVGKRFGQAVAIEVLEHVAEPFALLDSLLRAAPGGRVLFTTAHNLPQFDHVYNFAEFEVEEWLTARGRRAATAEKIVHAMLDGSTDTYNKFYVVEAGS